MPKPDENQKITLWAVYVRTCHPGDSFPESLGWRRIGYTHSAALAEQLRALRFSDAVEACDWPLYNLGGEAIFSVEPITRVQLFETLTELLPFTTPYSIQEEGHHDTDQCLIDLEGPCS
jgi:hypothetical protein